MRTAAIVEVFALNATGEAIDGLEFTLLPQDSPGRIARAAFLSFSDEVTSVRFTYQGSNYNITRESFR